MSNKENVSNLVRLIMLHPELPVIPMVQTEIVADDTCSAWMGSIGESSVQRYFLGEDKVHFYAPSDEDAIAELIDDPAFVGTDEFWDNMDNDALAKELYEEIPWKEAIIVNIDTPEI